MTRAWKIVALALSLAGCDVRDRGELEAEAAEFAKRLGVKVNGVSCVTRDSDGDGYVSCTIFLQDGRAEDIECAYPLAYSGCKRRVRPLVRTE